MEPQIDQRQNGSSSSSSENDSGGSNSMTNNNNNNSSGGGASSNANTTTTSNPPHPTTPLLVSFGNPLLDITAVVKDSELHKRFQLPVDGQLEVTKEQRPVFSHVMKEYPVEYTAGGCALNSSRVFCWVLGEPHRVVFVGGIGKDEAAKRLSDIVEESGVITRFVVVEEQPTGVCVALVLGACRCLCADIGAAATCLPQHVFAPQLRPVLEEAQFIYVEGYFITHSFPAALQIAQYAQQRQKTLVFNLCGSYVCENQSEELRRLLPYVDILFGFVEEYRTLDNFVDVEAMSAEQRHAPGNISHDLLLVLQAIRGEAQVVEDRLKGQGSPSIKASTGAEPMVDSANTQEIMNSDPSSLNVPNGEPDTEEVQHTCPGTPGTHNSHPDTPMEGGSTVPNGTPRQATNGQHHYHGAANGSQEGEDKQKLVVVTKGPSPLLYCHRGVVRQRPVPPITPEEIVDTTGAGDSFVGGFLAALSRGRPLDQCLDCGVWTAQQLLRQKGCTLPPCPADFLDSD